MKWLFRLNKSDLIDKLLGKTIYGCFVVKQNGDFFLSSRGWDSETDQAKVYNLAHECVRMINGITAQIEGRVDLSLDTLMSIDENGHRTVFSESAASPVQ